MPSMELDESDSIVPSDESLQFTPSDDEEQQYWKMRSIYRFPARLTDLNRKAYQPQVVSFGPYHHGEDHLLPMEVHKRRAIRHFLKRSRKPFKCFFESLREVAWDLEESYDTLDPKWKAGSSEGAAGQFLELMITDGCFMLEILRFATLAVDDYAPNDPIFSDHGLLYIMPDIKQDMLMLENQLPRLVLDRLVAVESDGKKGDEFVNGLILKFCSPGTHISVGSRKIGKGLHVLDVFRESMLMEPEKKDKVESKYGVGIIRSASATELSERGIWFNNSKTKSLKDISFVGGVLRLPRIEVDDTTESTFLNLLAFERFHVGAGNEVTSYIFFMDYIIDKGRDIVLLRTQGIVQNDLESDEAAAKLFNSLAKGATIDFNCSFYYVFERVDKYCNKRCNKRWNMWRANLIHTYFRNPWVILSLIAAVFLFALTTTQTVYTVLGCHN